MHSSISSSDFENEYQTLDPQGAVRVRAKTFVAGIIVSALIVGIYLQLATLVDLNGRVLGMMNYLPTFMAENRERQTMLIFGSSMVQAGFEPYQFDEYFAERGADVASINYGVGNLDPEFQKYLTRDVRRKYEASGQQIDLTLLEFNPFQTTITRGAFGDITRDQNEAILLSPADLWQITLEDPNRGIRLFNIRYLRNGLSAELISSSFAFANDENVSGQEAARRAASNRRSELGSAFQATLEEGVVAFPSDYAEALRGGRIDKRALSEESLAALEDYAASFRDSALMTSDQRRRILQGDILELGFDERLVLDFITMVNDLKAVSRNMEIVLLPRNTEWIVYRPEVQQKLDRLMQRISAETGVAVRDLQDHPAMSPEMFVDTTHLSFAEGIDAFTRLLAETYAPQLGD